MPLMGILLIRNVSLHQPGGYAETLSQFISPTPPPPAAPFHAR